jgi:hypothetical protein
MNLQLCADAFGHRSSVLRGRTEFMQGLELDEELLDELVIAVEKVYRVFVGNGS